MDTVYCPEFHQFPVDAVCRPCFTAPDTELLIVPDADHVDMYYNKEKIPFAKLKVFFEENLK